MKELTKLPDPQDQWGGLHLPQARVLRALEQSHPHLLSRNDLAKHIGYSPISGTLTRALNGIRQGSSSGPTHPGLLKLRMIEKLRQHGRARGVVYRITERGRCAMKGVRTLPSLRDQEACKNWRYIGRP
jgi:DNA-binding MarR family transcriptional regulator